MLDTSYYRLYTPEWVTVNRAVGHSTGEPGAVLATAWVWCQEYLTDIEPSDVRLCNETDLTIEIQVFKNVFQGEYNRASEAERAAEALGLEEFTVVPRNSKADHEIRSYGVRV